MLHSPYDTSHLSVMPEGRTCPQYFCTTY